MLLNILQRPRQSSTRKCYLVSNVKSVKVEKPWYKGNPYHWNLETKMTYKHFPNVYI